MFKDKEILQRLAHIEVRVDSIISMLKSEKIKNASKRAKEVKE